jgi:hypothetical protein
MSEEGSYFPTSRMAEAYGNRTHPEPCDPATVLKTASNTSHLTPPHQPAFLTVPVRSKFSPYGGGAASGFRIRSRDGVHDMTLQAPRYGFFSRPSSPSATPATPRAGKPRDLPALGVAGAEAQRTACLRVGVWRAVSVGSSDITVRRTTFQQLPRTRAASRAQLRCAPRHSLQARELKEGARP